MRQLLWMALLGLAPVPASADGCMVERVDPVAAAARRQQWKHDITEPGQKALIVFDGHDEDLILQVRYAGAADRFVWLVPTPGRPHVKAARPEVFRALSELTSPPPPRRSAAGAAGGGAFGGPVGGGAGPRPRVDVLEQRTVGILDTTVLDTNSADALTDWLRRYGYLVSDRLTAMLDDYVRRGWYFTAMRIDPLRAHQVGASGHEPEGEISPVWLRFATGEPVYPLKVSSLNGGTTDLLLYVATRLPLTSLGFRVEYARPLPPRVLAAATGGAPPLGPDMWLTKLSRRMRTTRMARDLSFFVLPGWRRAAGARGPRAAACTHRQLRGTPALGTES